MSWLDRRVKAPRTSSSAGISTLRQSQRVKYTLTEQSDLPRERSSEVKSTSNSGELREAVDVLQVGVVGNLEASADSGQLWQSDVVELVVADESKRSTNAGEVWRREVLECVAVEAERTVHGCERWHGHGGQVADGDVVGPLQVGEFGNKVLTVVGEGHGLSDVSELHVDRVEEAVVGDVDGVGDLEVDTVKGSELGVVNSEHVDFLHTGLREGEALESRQSDPVDGVNLGQSWEAEGRQNCQTIEVETLANLLQVGSTQLHNAGNVVGDEGAIDARNAGQVNVVGRAGGDGDAARVGRAAGQAGRVGSALDGGGGALLSALCCCASLAVLR